MFEWLPLSAIIFDKSTNHKVYLTHGGIGSSFSKVEDLEKVPRPLKVTVGSVNDSVQQICMDVLWSDPTASDDVLNLHPNVVRDPQKLSNIMMYGPDIVEKFLQANSFSMIIRGHSICMGGMDRFAAGQLITVTSCTNYAGTTGNDASFLVI